MVPDQTAKYKKKKIPPGLHLQLNTLPMHALKDHGFVYIQIPNKND